MKLRQWWIGVVLLVLLGMAAAVTQAQEKSYSASRFDVDVTVEEGGSVLVTETVVFDFTGGPFTFVFRELPLDHTDGITVLEASVDGVVYPLGTEPGQVEISGENPMRITWHLEPVSNAARTVVLTYRADGVVRREDGADTLYWQPLPDSYEYAIGESETAVTYPATTSLISEPAVLAGTAVITQSPRQTDFTAADLSPNSPLVFMMQFEEGSLISAPPAWQVAEQTAAEQRAAQNAQMPYWIGAAVLLLGAGLAGLVIYWRRIRPDAAKSKATSYKPPSDMAPGLAGVLTSDGASPTWDHAQGTMFDLAGRGLLIIEELDEKTWRRKRDFVVKQVEPGIGLHPHEEGFLDMLFADKNGRSTSIKLSAMGKKITGSAWKKYKEPLTAEMKQAGFLSGERRRARKNFFILGAALFFLGTAGFIALALLNETLGFGPMSIMGAVGLLGVASFILGSALSPLSDEGAETAVLWKQFSRYLKEVSKGKQAADSPTMFEKQLPYAAAFGLLHNWAKHFEEEGWTETPAYFHVLPTTTGDQAMVAFVTLAAVTHSSGGSAAAGAAGAGAAGGGASGAG